MSAFDNCNTCPFWWNCDGQCDEIPQIECDNELEEELETAEVE